MSRSSSSTRLAFLLITAHRLSLAQGPLGPYRFISHGPLVSHGETGGCIDPQPFVDPQTGKRHLVFKNDADKCVRARRETVASRRSSEQADEPPLS